MANAAGGRRPGVGRSGWVASSTREYVRDHAEGTAPSDRRAGLPASSRRIRRTYEMTWCSSAPAAASPARHTLLRRLLQALERAAAANRRQRQPRASSSESQSSRESGQGSEHETRGSAQRAAPASSHLVTEDFRVTRHGTSGQRMRTSFRLLQALERAAAANRRQRQPRASSSESQSSRESGQGSEHETRGSAQRAAPASSHLVAEDFRVTRHGTSGQRMRTSFRWSREVRVPARTRPREPSTSVSQP
ncbi:uncharacterized protein [Dermacentor albipictus]|uniref:uncharacterized protein n=1 Tax=Dermacentor albipictus TaxID=60249 RepID=UPI0031FC8235